MRSLPIISLLTSAFGLQNGNEKHGIIGNGKTENKNINKIMFGQRGWEWGTEKNIYI